MADPEQLARQKIDAMLTASGWAVQKYTQYNPTVSQGVALCEVPMKSGHCDYLLLVDRKPVGVIEAKREGTPLSGVEDQTADYGKNLPEFFANPSGLPFLYESTGVETKFRDARDPDCRSRNIFTFHRPETLVDWMKDGCTLRARLQQLPPLATSGMRACQIEAITNLEKSFAQNRPRALIQMATGSGKTFTAVSFIYRLIKHANAKRILFLVDRSNLGRQTVTEFQQYVTPDTGRKFTELYNIQHLTSGTIDPVARVTVSTIQRLYSVLRGEELAEDVDEASGFEVAQALTAPRSSGRESAHSSAATKQMDVAYNTNVPIEAFDFIVTDECHRSIYNLWRQVLEYFDASLIGLTATPSKQTIGFFNQNLVMEYGHERAVADGVNVGYEVYRIKTEVSERGGKVEAGFYVDKRHRETRARRWEQLDEELTYANTDLDRSVVVPSQIRTVLQRFKDSLFTELFPSRTLVPKTLIFAKDDSHAEDIVQIVREVFGKGNDFAKKITYKTFNPETRRYEKSESLIQEFRTSPTLRIAVTVDMIATGTDIKPLECLVFLRDVRSRVYFEQMKGRGTRVLSPTDLQSVSGEAARAKTHFVIVDAVGVCESDKTDSRPLERQRSVAFDKLLLGVALGKRDEDSITTLAGRLAKLDREIAPNDRKKIEQISGGKTLPQLVNALIDSIDQDKIRTTAVAGRAGSPQPAVPLSEQELSKARETLVTTACAPFDNPALRDALAHAKQSIEQTIDTVTIDRVTHSGFDAAAKEKAENLVKSFRDYIEQHKAEIEALQILYSRPYRHRLTEKMLKDLEAKLKDPFGADPTNRLWNAFELVGRDAAPRRPDRPAVHRFADLVSLVRYSLQQQPALKPFAESVHERFNEWLMDKAEAGVKFDTEQLTWLNLIRDHIATSLSIEPDDFDYAPFSQRGGLGKAHQLFGGQLMKLLEELNERLAA